MRKEKAIERKRRTSKKKEIQNLNKKYRNDYGSVPKRNGTKEVLPEEKGALHWVELHYHCAKKSSVKSFPIVFRGGVSSMVRSSIMQVPMSTKSGRGRG